MKPIWQMKGNPSAKVEVVETISYIPAGGGFVRKLAAGDFLASFEPVPDEKQPFGQLRRAIVSATWYEEGRVFWPCWAYEGDHWNGFGKPYFERAQMEYLGNSALPNLEYDEDRDRFIDKADDLEAIRVPNILNRLYDLAHCGYCWSQPVFPLAGLNGLSDAFPERSWCEGPAAFGDKLGEFIFIRRSDTVITNPFESVCGRFPQPDRYGLTQEEAEAMLAINMTRAEEIRDV